MVKLVHQPGVKNKEGKKHTIKSRTKEIYYSICS